MSALTAASSALVGMVSFLPFILLGIITFKWPNPVFYMLNGGISIIVAYYMADIINAGVTTNLTIAYSLAFIMYGLVNEALAFITMFTRRVNEKT